MYLILARAPTAQVATTAQAAVAAVGTVVRNHDDTRFVVQCTDANHNKARAILECTHRCDVPIVEHVPDTATEKDATAVSDADVILLAKADAGVAVDEGVAVKGEVRGAEPVDDKP
jgi:hypothetical protein